MQPTGEGGLLLQQLTKRLLKSALEGEMTDHLGYDRHDTAGWSSEPCPGWWDAAALGATSARPSTSPLSPQP